jgi:hypothetical protein
MPLLAAVDRARADFCSGCDKSQQTITVAITYLAIPKLPSTMGQLQAMVPGNITVFRVISVGQNQHSMAAF